MPSAVRVPKYIGRGAFLDVPTYTGNAGKALVVNAGATGYEYVAFEASGAVAAHVALANPHTQYLLSSGYTAADVLTKLLTVDTDGSGLNATTLQGNAPGAFATSGHNHSSTYQPLDGELTAIAGLVSAADKLPYFTGPGTAALADFSAYGRTLADDADAATARATLGLGTIATATETNYVLAAGSRAGATSQAQIFTLGIGINTGATAPATLFQVADTVTTSPRGIMSSQHNTGTDGARLHLRKSRGSLASPTVIATGDTLGRVVASGYDGSNYLEMGAVSVVASGTIASTRVPTEIQFYTATDAAPSVLTQRMTIDNQGRVGIGGTPSFQVDATDQVRAQVRVIGGAFTVGGGVGSGDKIITDGTVRAASVNVRGPTFGDAGFAGLKASNTDLQLWANSALVTTIINVGAGTGDSLIFSGQFNPSSGSGASSVIRLNTPLTSNGANSKDYAWLKIDPSITQNTFGTGFVRGIYYAPNIFSLNTSVHRGIEISSGDSILGSTSGNVGAGGITTPTAVVHIGASTTARAQLRFDPTSPADPTSPNSGDLWFNAWLKFRRGATTEQIASGVQGTGAAQTAGALYTATEQDMLQKIYNAGRAFGLIA